MSLLYVPFDMLTCTSHWNPSVFLIMLYCFILNADSCIPCLHVYSCLFVSSCSDEVCTQHIHVDVHTPRHCSRTLSISQLPQVRIRNFRQSRKTFSARRSNSTKRRALIILKFSKFSLSFLAWTIRAKTLNMLFGLFRFGAGDSSVVHVSMVREPLDRLVSSYYFKRYGDTFHGDKRHSKYRDTTVSPNHSPLCEGKTRVENFE